MKILITMFLSLITVHILIAPGEASSQTVIQTTPAEPTYGFMSKRRLRRAGHDMSDDQMLTSSSSPTAYLTNDTVGFDIFRGAPNSPGTARLYANGNIEVSNLFGANRIIARMTDTNKIVDSDTGADVEINGTPITINSTADICILSWSGC